MSFGMRAFEVRLAAAVACQLFFFQAEIQALKENEAAPNNGAYKGQLQ